MTREALTRRYAIHQAMHWMITGISIPILVLLFQSRGLSLQDIGFVMAVWVGSTALLEVPLGGVADRYGRKTTYLLSLLVNIMGCCVLFYAAGLGPLLVAALFLGASRAIYSGTLDAWFYDSFQLCLVADSDNLGRTLTFHKAQAWVNISVTVGLAAGSVFGGWLPDYMASSGVEIASIYDANIAVVIAANIVLLAITLRLINEAGDQGHSVQAEFMCFRTSFGVITKAFSHAVIRRLMQTTIVYGAVLSSVETFWQPYLLGVMQHSAGTNVGVDNITAFGVIAGLYFFMSSLSSLCSIRLLTFVGGSHKTLLFATRLFSGAVLIMMANSSDTMSFSALYLLFFFCFTLGNSSQSVLINDNTEARHRSTMLSVSSLMVTSGAVCASLLFGVVSEHYGISLSWVMCGVGLMASSVLFVFMPEQRELATR
ncbi:MFS transporter [Photobacterium lutimaris]|nr:MFS transporter [Photobacterium lutimaris]TDR74994.1 putative MFS family arabinose efflux permease [Photobacterium lutimaris]